MTVKEIHALSPQEHRSLYVKVRIFPLQETGGGITLYQQDSQEGIFYSQKSQEFSFKVLE